MRAEEVGKLIRNPYHPTEPYDLDHIPSATHYVIGPRYADSGRVESGIALRSVLVCWDNEEASIKRGEMVDEVGGNWTVVFGPPRNRKGVMMEVIELEDVETVRESVSSNHFSVDDQANDAMRWLLVNKPDAYHKVLAVCPEWIKRVMDGPWFDTKAMSVDVEWGSWLVDAIESTGVIMWEDGEPWVM